MLTFLDRSKDDWDITAVIEAAVVKQQSLDEITVARRFGLGAATQSKGPGSLQASAKQDSV